MKRRSSNMERRSSNMERRSSNMERRSSNMERRSSNMERRSSSHVGKFTITQKFRRRTRSRPTRTIMTRSQVSSSSCSSSSSSSCSSSSSSSSSSSLFSRLPAEVFDLVLDQLTVVEVSVFSMASKEISQKVVDYVSTLSWRSRTVLQTFHDSTCRDHSSIMGHYRDLGLLFKRCTLLLPTKERLKFIFSKFSQVPCFLLEQCFHLDCSGFSCYGVFLQTLIAGWDQLECQRVFNFLCDITNLLHKMETVISGKPGVQWFQQVQLRLFCRQVLLDPWSSQQETQFWLLLLLKPWPLVSQAHLLFIFYGPVRLHGRWCEDQRGLERTREDQRGLAVSGLQVVQVQIKSAGSDSTNSCFCL
ncbi:F-box only protein 47-like [Centropristis striata]|uniref:F-box only protein 47-like n=1 Tax=Centropristis striata TaxID=184440 RepID=UPI0027E0C253|nr:F-box only protein 47-like [Centropristis striata]